MRWLVSSPANFTFAMVLQARARATSMAQCRANFVDRPSPQFGDTDATLDDLREAVATLEEIERIARRVLGGAHPLARWIEAELQSAPSALRARETPSGEA